MSKIIGQDLVQKEVSKIFEVFRASNGLIRPHFILTGESGSGKSFIIKSIAKAMDFAFLEINAAQITKEGTAGNSLSKALSPINNYKNKLTIVFCDEFDKLFISGNTNNTIANEVTVGVQNEFLKVLESETSSVYGDYGKYVDADMTKTLFVFAGAFNNEADINLDRLRSFGIKTEFLGRVGLVYNLKRLTLDDMYLILEQSDLLDSYLKLFQDANRQTVISDIKSYLKDIYDNNDLGARIINTLIHQWFIKGGKLGDDDVKPVTFQTKLSLN